MEGAKVADGRGWCSPVIAAIQRYSKLKKLNLGKIYIHAGEKGGKSCGKPPYPCMAAIAARELSPANCEPGTVGCIDFQPAGSRSKSPTSAAILCLFAETEHKDQFGKVRRTEHKRLHGIRPRA
jgi:hypothetical protein